MVFHIAETIFLIVETISKLVGAIFLTVEMVSTVAGAIFQVAGAASTVADAISKLAGAAPAIVGMLSQLAGGIFLTVETASLLCGGISTVVGGVPAIVGAASKLAEMIPQLAEPAPKIAGAAAQVAEAAPQLARVIALLVESPKQMEGAKFHRSNLAGISPFVFYSAMLHMKSACRPLVKLALCAVFLAGTAMLPAAPRPNVILILADDLGFGDLGCYGSLKNKTPNLDRMAAQGARLTHFNTPAPFCAPTRAALMTGRYPFRCGMPENPAPDGGPDRDGLHLPESEVTLAQLFKEAGYATGIVGKWHLGHAKPEWLPTHRGFDEYFGIPYSNDMRPVALFEGDQKKEYPLIQANVTKRYTERALDFIERNKARPFFLYWPHAMPHKPLAVSEDYYKKSGAGLYADVMSELDWSIGQLLAKLKDLGLDEKTFVAFTSDNGAWFGGSCGGLRGMKGSSYEGGYRVPCIARWPGKIPAGHESAQPAVMMDLFATALKVANIASPKDRVIDGRDILPLFTSGAKSPHAVIVGAQGARLATARDERWKLHVLPPKDMFAAFDKPGERWIDLRAPDGVTILAPYEQAQPGEHPGRRTGVTSKAMQLFDLLADPGEQHDVAAKNPAVMVRLKKGFDEIAKDAPLPPPAKEGK